ncbi:hypothetical protein [Aquimarina sp. MMG016]|uniref:hypothetical protein n=1 Tax=Aquimarina sp. MMG016 TaxID=2822690 RepID=UPI001B3A063B|nr:hypothetical protein [Aquimarina sp. MMG016]MBQ4820292.1 hypothetical protein [Aquimarina sp. MMG016]
MKNQLVKILNNWDGKHIEYLINCYDQYADDNTFFDILIEITYGQTELQTATTWIIKHHYDGKKSLSESLADQLLSSINQLKNWGAKLHILQLLPKIHITKNTVNPVDQFVRKCLNDDNKFVRAWSYQGLYEVSKHIPEYESELRSLCKRAMQTESASIRSRVRKVLSILDDSKNDISHKIQQ